jgi:apolipoprotein N-acyltransferase
VEHRVPYLRSANTGISGWVDPLGRYHKRTPLYQTAVVIADLPLPDITTVYTRWGNWVPMVALAVWAGLLLVGRRSRETVVEPRRERPAVVRQPVGT